MSEFTLNDVVRAKLAEALLEDEDLLISLRRARPVEDLQRAGLYRCQCTVAVRRPLDPETSELRELEISLRRTEGGFEALDLTGLEGVATQLEA